MEPGIYELTQDLPALQPDRRVTHDWRAKAMLKGTLFAVRREEIEPGVPYTEITRLDGFSHHSVNIGSKRISLDALLANLSPVPVVTPSQYFMLTYHESSADEVLDELCARGIIDLETIKRVSTEIVAERGRKHAEEAQ